MESSKSITITLSKEQVTEIDQLARRSGYRSRSAFLRMVLASSLTEDFRVFKPRALEAIAKDLRTAHSMRSRFVQDVIKGLKRSSVYAKHPTSSH